MIDFLKYTKVYFFLSALVIGIGLFSIVRWGFIYSIDFVGGTNLQYQFDKKPELKVVRNIFTTEHIEILSLDQKDNIISARTKAIDEKTEAKLKNDLAARLKAKLIVLQSETVGPVLGREMMVKTAVASLLAILGILIYMSFAFASFNFAVSAILAMIHDFLVVIGSYSLFSHFLGAQVDTLFVTAVLTAMSFSVHDTIIIFDKIREYKKESLKGSISFYANQALTETLVRSLNNSMTIIFMLLALTLMGGVTIRFFVATLLVGTITGTYSSPFIATPLLLFLEKRKI